MYDYQNIPGALKPSTLRGPERFPFLFWFGYVSGPTFIEEGYTTVQACREAVRKYASKGDPDFKSGKDAAFPETTVSYLNPELPGTRLASCTVYSPDRKESVTFDHEMLDTAISRAKWASSMCFYTLEGALEGFDDASKKFARVQLDRMQGEGWTLTRAWSDLQGVLHLNFQRPSKRESTNATNALGVPVECEFLTLFDT